MILPDSERREETRTSLIRTDKKCSSWWDMIFNPAKDKLWTCVSVQMWKLTSFNTKPVFSCFQFVTSTNMDCIVITEFCFYLLHQNWFVKAPKNPLKPRLQGYVRLIHLFCSISQS